MNPRYAHLFREAEAIHQALSSRRKFCERYLSDGPFQVDLYGWYHGADAVLEQRKPDGQRTFTALFVPPGWGKTRGYTVTETVRRVAQDRGHRVGLFSKSKGKSENYMHAIKAILKGNEKLQADTGGPFITKDTVANTQEIRVIGSIEGETTPSVANMGMSGQVESMRFNTLIIDDAVDREIAFSQAEVDHFISRMKNTFFPRLEPGGQLIVIGSRFSAMDGYHWILENPLFAGHTYVLPALTEGPGPEEYLPTCPERFGLQDLMNIQGGMGVTAEGDYVESSADWNARYMQEPSGDSEMSFKWDWINPKLPAIMEDKWTTTVPDRILCFVDPAYSTAKDADYMGGVAVGMIDSEDGKTQNPVLVGMMGEKIASRFSERVQEFRQKYMASRLYVEVNNARTFGDDLRRMGEPARDIVSTTGKVMRIGDLEVWLRNSRANGGLLFHESLLDTKEWRLFTKEYMYFPNAKHDHILDSLEMAKRTLRKGRSGVADPSGLFG